jgi:hypothetical protein
MDDALDIKVLSRSKCGNRITVVVKNARHWKDGGAKESLTRHLKKVGQDWCDKDGIPLAKVGEI